MKWMKLVCYLLAQCFYTSTFRCSFSLRIMRRGYFFVSQNHLWSDRFDERFLACYPEIFDYISRAFWKSLQVQNKHLLLNSWRKLIQRLVLCFFFFKSLLTDGNSSLITDTHIYLLLSKCVWVNATIFLRLQKRHQTVVQIYPCWFTVCNSSSRVIQQKITELYQSASFLQGRSL